MTRAVPGLLRVLAACGWLVCCRTDQPDAVARVEYTSAAMEQRVLRRLRLVHAGVPLRDELAADSVWSNALRYTFIARRAVDGETGIRAIVAVRDGVPVRGRPRGIRRAGPKAHRLDEGFHFVDVFDEWDRHLGTVVADTAMGSRRLLQHLGQARRCSAQVDRLYLSVKGVTRWRTVLPAVEQSGGYGPLYARRDGRKSQSAEGIEGSDTLTVYAERFELEQLEDYTLVGRNGTGEHYRHIFQAGGRYLVTAVCYAEAPLDGPALLREVGLATAAPTLEPENGPAPAGESAGPVDLGPER